MSIVHHTNRDIEKLARKLNEMKAKITSIERSLIKTQGGGIQVADTRGVTESAIVLDDITDLSAIAGLALKLTGTRLDVEVAVLIEPTSTGIETKTGVSKGATLDMSSLSYDRLWVHIIKGATGYTSATILLQVCDNDSEVDAEWETLGTFTLTANETDSINKKWSFPFARLNITAFVGDDIKINLGATV